MSSKIISHISIIMDGNGRWANQRNMPRAYGHKEGVNAIDKIVSACSLRQISQLSLFAFSSENWNRPEYEVQFLLKLFEDSIAKYIDDSSQILAVKRRLTKFNRSILRLLSSGINSKRSSKRLIKINRLIDLLFFSFTSLNKDISPRLFFRSVCSTSC